eukprot:1064314-Pelagomonas_calceolata.AAC.1
MHVGAVSARADAHQDRYVGLANAIYTCHIHRDWLNNIKADTHKGRYATGTLESGLPAPMLLQALQH